MTKASDPSTKKFWRIVGFDSTRRMFETVVPYGFLSDKQATCLLQRLVSRRLSEDEIVASSLRKNCNGYEHHLEPSKDSGPDKRYTICVGVNPYYAASVWTGAELADRKKQSNGQSSG